MNGIVLVTLRRPLTTTVGTIEHGESHSLYGRGIVKIFFQPGTSLNVEIDLDRRKLLAHGKQAVLIEVLKSGDASTLAVVAGVKRRLPGIIRTLPPGVTITPFYEASAFARAFVDEFVQEMVIGGMLVATFATLLFVPCMFALLHGSRKHRGSRA